MRFIYTFFILLFCTITAFSQNYTVQGDAVTYGGCNCFKLNPNAKDQGGAAYQNKTINLNNSFDYTFSVFLGCNNGSGADGICFVLSNNIQALGAKGGGLGYGGLAGNSLCAEFDTYQNGGEPIFQHTALESGGSTSHNVQGPVSILPSQGNVDDCANHTVRIVWDVNAQTYSVYFDGNLRLTYAGNIVTAFFGGNPIVNWGWSGSTGGGTNEQRFCVISNSNWQAGTNYQSCNKTIQFNDISTSNVGSVQSWAWNFGEPASGTANTSSLQNPTHTYASTGTFTVSLTITDISGCANTYSHAVTINPPISIASTLTSPACNGDATGSITTVPSGGFGAATGYYLPTGYKYTWNDNSSGSSHVGLTAGTVTITVTDGVCSSTATYTLNQPPALSAVTSHTDATCGASNGTATITISGGTPPYSGINWGLAFPGASVSGLGTGTFIADFKDANGCSSLLQYKEVIAQLPCGYNLSTSKTDVVCFGAATGSATLTVTGGTAPITITWTKGGVGAGSGATINGLTAGNYDYNYSDGAGKVFTGTVTVNQPGAAMVASITTINTSCSYLNDGSALASVTSGGVSPFNYAWSGAQPNAPTANGLSPGPISVTVTDSKTCTASATASVSGQPAIAPNVTFIDDSCYLSKTGSATVNATGGNPGYTYVWSNSAIGGTAYNLGIGTYKVTVTDKNNCTATATATLNQPPQLTYTLTHNNVKCFGGSTGDATITPSGGNGGYTYSWSNATSLANTTGLVANKYYVTASDSKKCKVTDSVTITQPTLFKIQEDSINVKCKGLPTGSITLTPSGGTTPYGVCNWGAGVTGLSRTTLAAGMYNYTILDANSCPVSGDINITEPATAFSLSHVQTDVKCFGDATGTITLSQAGGTTPYATPQWLDLAVGLTRTGLSAGTYIAVDSDANGCLDSLHILITQPASAFTVAKASTPVLCNGGTTGTATLTLSGGTTPYGAVTWSDAGTGTNRTGLSQGTYGYTVSDANGCKDTGSVVITQPTKFVVTEDSINVKCKGLPTGSITLTPSGGTTPYGVCNWGAGVTGLSRTTLAVGMYNYTILDANSCPVSGDINITEPASAFSLSHVQTDVKCFGDATGTITLSQAGGTTPYATPQWLDLAVGLTRTGLSAGTYIAVDSDANGCLDSLHILITQPATAFTVAKASTPVLCNGGTTGTATLTLSGGTTPYGAVTWSDAGAGTSRAGLSQGTYGYTVSDANGCKDTGSVTITQPSKFVVTEDSINVKCKGLPTGSITLTPSGGTTPYGVCNWGAGITGLSRTTLAAGMYNYTILDANSCPVSGDINITEPASAFSLSHVQTDVKCFGDPTGTITLSQAGGTTPYATPQWLDGQVGLTRIGLSSGTYIAVDSDANGCLDSLHILITQPLAGMVANTSATSATCSYKADGTATATVTSGGTGPFKYAWSNAFTENNVASSTASALTPQNYTVTITDQGNCTIATTVLVGSPPAISSQITVTDVKCFGNATGAVNVTAAGGTGPVYTFAWSANAGAVGNNPIATNLAMGTYTFTITDGNNCELDTFATVAQPTAALSFQTPVTVKNVSCNGGNDGKIQYVVSGGTSPYSYTWSGTAAGSQDIASNLVMGTYVITIADANGCSLTNSITITEPTAMSISSQTQTEVSCNGGNNGTATVTISGGTPGYTYTWNPNAGSGNAVGSLTAGPYNVTVKDANQCSITTSFTISEPTKLIATASQVDILCNGDNSGSITVTPNGGTPASTGYTFNWNPNVSTSNTASTLTAGGYSIVVADSLLCSTTVNVTVTEASLLVPSVVSTVNEPCFGDSKGVVQLGASGGTPAYQYEISVDGINFTTATNGNATGLVAGSYTARITDGNTCKKTIPFTITEPTQIVAAFSNDSAKCFGESNGSIAATASGGTPSYTYTFSDGQSNSTGIATALPAGNYDFTVTDVAGCSTTLTTTIYQPDSIELSVTPADATIDLGESIQLQASSNYATIVYEWKPSNGLSCTTCDAPLSTTYQSITYTLTGTINPNGKACTATIKVPVTVIPNYNLYIPNAFTPNSDGSNDYFEVFGNKKAMKFIEIQIFDRWGEKVFESNDLNFKWDGAYKGAQLNPGTFVYQLKAVFLDDHTERDYKGSILLLR